MFRWLLALSVVFAWCGLGQAHFLWLIPGEKPNTVRIVFSDKLGVDTDNSELIDRVKSARLYVHDPESKHIDLNLEKTTGALVAALPEKAHVVRGRGTYGVFQRGDNPPSLLNYFCIYKQGDLKESSCFNCQPFQVREESPGVFLVEYDAEPVANSEVVIVGPDGFKELKGQTNKEGKVTFDMNQAPKGMYGVRAKHVLKEPGEHQGKKYESITNYVTLVHQR